MQRSFFFSSALVAGAMTVGPMVGGADAALVGFNAEDGSSVTTNVTANLGDQWTPAESDPNALGSSFITPATSPGGGSPQFEDEAVSYDIDFAEAGEYDLHARLQIEDEGNPDGGFGNDSLHVGSGFGDKDPFTDSDWDTANRLFEEFDADQYFWVNLSEYDLITSGTTLPDTYTVGSADSTETFELGAREDGLRVDALAFGTADQEFTDQQLSNAVVPTPGALPAGLALLGGMAIASGRTRRGARRA